MLHPLPALADIPADQPLDALRRAYALYEEVADWPICAVIDGAQRHEAIHWAGGSRVTSRFPEGKQESARKDIEATTKNFPIVLRHDGECWKTETLPPHPPETIELVSAPAAQSGPVDSIMAGRMLIAAIARDLGIPSNHIGVMSYGPTPASRQSVLQLFSWWREIPGFLKYSSFGPMHSNVGMDDTVIYDPSRSLISGAAWEQALATRFFAHLLIHDADGTWRGLTNPLRLANVRRDLKPQA